MNKVEVYLAGTDDMLLGINADLAKITDHQLNEIFVAQLCGHDKPFCDHCFGGKISFEITRCCDHKLLIWPMKDGKRIESLEATDVE